MRRFLPILAIAASYVLVFVTTGVASPGKHGNPHVFMEDPARCGDCHLEERPGKGRPYRLMNFRKDIFSICSECHTRPLTHPIEIAPGKRMAKDLPLDPDGTMTCITCHAPHSAPYGDRLFTGRSLFEKIRDTFLPRASGKYRTYFLRLPALHGELCEACHSLRELSGSLGKADKIGRIPQVDPRQYAGSRACAGCHSEEYRMWARSPHARMVRSPRKNPDAVLAGFEGTSPFPRSEIAFVLGSRNVQRFLSRRSDTLVVRTPIWLIRSGTWNLSYWRERDWLKSCAGCHTTGYDPFRRIYAEESVSCEACHGPGKAHASSGNALDIVHPSKISPVRRDMICESCHTTGHDATGEFRFPVGFVPGEDLTRFFFGLVPKPGQGDSSFLGNGRYDDRHRQFLYWRERMLIAEGETCDLCQNFRMARAGGGSGGPRKMTSQEFCISCHDGTITPPPRFHDRLDGGERKCLSCHPMAKTEKGLPSIHDHKYLPSNALAKNDFIPAPDSRTICFVCHAVPGEGA